MSFRLFVYSCALVGAWTGIAAWAVGHYSAEKIVASNSLILQDGVRGMFLGVLVAFGLGLVDSLWNVGWRQIGVFSARLAVAVAVGALGGFVGGSLAQWLVSLAGNVVPIICFFVLGWTIAGLMIGAAIGAFDWIVNKLRRRAAGSKFFKCTIGGGLGGSIGGLAAYTLREGWTALFSAKDPAQLWSPTAVGFATLGLFIGLLVGLTQIFLKTAWIKVEAGFRPGREMILSKDVTSIGRVEGADIALFGDPGVEKTHAQIVLDGVRYWIEDAGSAGGTFVNEKKIAGRVALRSGDLVRVGKSALRFSEKRRR